MALTAHQRHLYESDGYLVVPGLIPLAQIALLRKRLDELEEAAHSARAPTVMFQVEKSGSVATRPSLRKFDEPARQDEAFLAVVSTPAVLDVATELTGGGPHLMMYSDQVFMKPAFCGSEKPLHQDNSYFKVTPNSAGITCWIALDDATVENGCLHYIPGSHKLGLVKHRELRNTPHLTPDVDYELPAQVPVPVPAGSCIFHHLLAMHCSKANTSARQRRAYAVHYANRSAEHSVRPWNEMIPLR